jgi:hypothetical protein
VKGLRLSPALHEQAIITFDKFLNHYEVKAVAAAQQDTAISEISEPISVVLSHIANHHAHSHSGEHIAFDGVAGQVKRLQDSVFTIQQTAPYSSDPIKAVEVADVLTQFVSCLADKVTLDTLEGVMKAKELTRRKLEILFATSFTKHAKAWTALHTRLSCGGSIRIVCPGVDDTVLEHCGNWVEAKFDQAVGSFKMGCASEMQGVIHI